MRIVVLGYIVRGPMGGLCWHIFQYVLGFKKLGFEVLFLEDSDNYPSCYNPDIFQTTTDCSYGLKFIDKLFKKYCLQKSWAYYDEHTNSWFGQSRSYVTEFCNSSDLVLNISNMNPLREWWTNIPVRILLDTDPAFTQMRHLEEENSRKVAEHHTDFFTFGENFGKQNCRIPDDGFNWKPTRQPVVLDLWKVSEPLPNGRWTTVMLWDSYKVRHFKGLNFGMKSASFDDYFELPTKINDRFELAVGNTTAPRERLISLKWNLSDSSTITETPHSYQHYIQCSKGEWSIAKHGYVVSNGGWFSERSTCYLATGKPVVVQETGFSKFIETGKGLFAFNSPAEAIAAIEEINLDYQRHCNYARKVVEEYFDSKFVLNTILEKL